MEPICVESKQGSYIITHRCQACGIERRIKADKADDFEAIIAIARNWTYIGDRFNGAIKWR